MMVTQQTAYCWRCGRQSLSVSVLSESERALGSNICVLVARSPARSQEMVLELFIFHIYTAYPDRM